MLTVVLKYIDSQEVAMQCIYDYKTAHETWLYL